jgi:hypothetical protein
MARSAVRMVALGDGERWRFSMVRLYNIGMVFLELRMAIKMCGRSL